MNEGTNYASSRRRFGGWALDALIAAIVFTPFALVVAGEPTIRASEAPVAFAAEMVLLFLYLVAFDGGSRGATPGKRIVGTRVADVENGGPIGYRRATWRRLVYIIGGALLWIGWLWLIWDPRRQAWHDKAARSVVIRSG